MSQTVPLSRGDWTDLGPTPMVLDLAGEQPALYLTAASAPHDLGQPSRMLMPGQSMLIGAPSMRVFARGAQQLASPVPPAVVVRSLDEALRAAEPVDLNLARSPGERAAAIAASMGIPVAAPIPFARMGEPRIFQVGPDTALIQQPVAIPPNATVFRYTNNNPFAVRLVGTPEGREFVPVTPTTGWVWLPGTSGIFTTVRPALISCMAVDGPNASVQAAQRAGRGSLELQYGVGSRS